MSTIVRALTQADIPAAMRIKDAAGWNQTAEDWRTLLRLAPDTCFGIDCDGVLASTTTAICYGSRLAWIGMVLTDPSFRHRGLARCLLEHTLAVLDARGIDWIKLDATEMGAPIYQQFGFEDEGAVERWQGIGEGSALTHGAWSGECLGLDGAAFGADRSRLLARLASHDAAEAPGEGFAMGRAGSRAPYFGPCVCRSAETARALAGWFLRRHVGEPVYWDVLAGNAEAVRLARELGFEPVRHLVRMVRRGVPGAAPLAHDDSLVFGIAGFEFG